ncbi:Alginate lyase [Novipirellula aureliae]|uniref:Alginate lyase n=1 Tax=Novipirellula aureliae TaxID=2527966 RepID=A0A5C6DQK1_9BACT|nr:alginate lyase family protein [Novipirellula aureliae]TWU37921.1 Alginate lyase [Novipirellula aureliae]
MKSLLRPIAITPVLIVLILSQASFAQNAKVERAPMIHPGILMTGEQLDLMRDRINRGIEPQKSAFEVLKNDRRAVKNYTPNTEHFKWGSGERDAQACWIQALMWSVTQEEVYAENVLNIMDAYSTLEEVTGKTKDLRIGLMGTMFMRGAEIVKHTYPKWRPETEKKFMAMYDKAFMPTLLKRVEHENNWMSSITESLMATAIFKDDPELFDLAVYRLKIYLPTNVPLENGQPAELWRDIAHSEEGLGALIQTCEMAWNQGVDAYAWLDYRLAKGFEYLGEVVDTKDDRFEKNYPLDVGWEIVNNHYHYRMGMDMPWTQRLVQTVRPEGLFRHTSLGTLTKGEMDKDRPVAISHWRLPIAYIGAPYSHPLKRYGCTSPVEWVQDAGTTMPSGLKVSSSGQITGNVEAAPGVYKLVLKSSGSSCDPVSTTYYLPVKNLLPAAQVNVAEPGLWYEYRTPHFDTDPGLDSFESSASGTTPTFSFSVAKDEQYAIRFSGYLDVPADGNYSFQVGTENQSRLYIDDQLVVDHWMRDNRARIAWAQFDSELGLKAGKHKIVLTVNNGNYRKGMLYGEWPSMRNLFEVQWKIPGATSHDPIPKSALSNPGDSSALRPVQPVQ